MIAALASMTPEQLAWALVVAILFIGACLYTHNDIRRIQ